jgi:hypothetical protein
MLVVLVHFGLMYHAIESYSAWGGKIFTNPWYAAVAIPWMLVLVGCGAQAAPGKWLRFIIVNGVPAVSLVSEAFGTLVTMPWEYYRSKPFGPTALSRMASIHPACMGWQTFLALIALTVGLDVVIVCMVATRNRERDSSICSGQNGVAVCL